MSKMINEGMNLGEQLSLVRTIFLFNTVTKVKINLPSPTFFVQIFSFTGLCFQMLMEQTILDVF